MEKEQKMTDPIAKADGTGEEPAAVAEELAPAATDLRAAWEQFFASLSAEDRAALTAALDRLIAAEEHQLASEARAAEEATMAELEGEAAFAGICERAEAIRALIARISWLRALPMRERLVAALYLDRGMRLHEPTPEEKLEAVLSDPALMRALSERMALLRDRERALRPPTVRASHGARMPARLPEVPKNLKEAEEAAHHYFKIRK